MAAAAILTLIPAVNFSGFLYPASEIEGAGRLIHAIFPGAWFQQVSLGAFVKARSLADLAPAIAVLAVLGLVQLAAARVLLKKQEA
jgi:ribosome-dependent ATPase